MIRIWEKFGADADNNGAFQCIWHMAEIDPDLAMQWSAEKGHRYDAEVRQAEARNLAEADPAGALALLNQKPDTESQSVLQVLADAVRGDRRPQGTPLRGVEPAIQFGVRAQISPTEPTRWRRPAPSC